MTNKLTFFEQEVLFTTECKLINLKYEYHGYTGDENWAIVSELTEKELMEKYPDVIVRYVPFVLLSIEQGETIAEFHRIEHKHEQRSKRYGSIYGYDDEAFEEHHPELAVVDRIFDEIEMQEALNTLTEIQRTRIIKRFFAGMTYRDIAESEGCHYTSVKESVRVALDKMKKYFM